MIGFTSLKRLLLATATLGFAAHAAAAEPSLLEATRATLAEVEAAFPAGTQRIILRR